jgi:HEAT repeat protein
MNKLLGLSFLAALALAAGADQDEPRIQGKPLSDWVKELNDPAVGVRLTTVQKLAALGVQAQPAVPALVKALKDRSLAMRQSVAQALQRIGPGAVTALAEALKGKDTELRRGAAEAFRLMYRPPPQAQAALAEAAKDKDAYVRINATLALHQTRFTTEGIAAIHDVLTTGLKDEDAGVRRLAAGLAGSVRAIPGPAGQRLREAVVAALKDRDLGVRLAAANTLVPPYSLGPERPVSVREVLVVFTEALKAADEDTRRQAATALARLGARAVPAASALAAALKDKDATVRQYAAFTLGQIGSEAEGAVTALAEALGDRAETVRQLAAQALSAIGPAAREAVPALIAAIKDADAGVRLSAVEALGHIGPAAKQAVPALLDVLDKGDKGPLPAPGFGRFPAPFGQPLGSPRFLSPASARQLAAEALGRIGPDAKGAVPALFKVLKDDAHGLRDTAAVALRGIGKPAVSALAKGLQDDTTRLVCMETLGSIGEAPEKAIFVLAEALADKNEEVRRQAAFALGQLGEKAKPAVPALTKVLSAEENGSDLRGMAAQALGEIGPDAAPALAALRKALKDSDPDPFVLHRAAYALGRIGPKAKEAVPALKELLKFEDAYVRQAAKQALKQIGE